MQTDKQAPTFVIPNREIVAIEHPCIIRDVDAGLKTFGNATPLDHIIGDTEGSLPLYLRPEDATSAPTLSTNVPTSNIVLKITVSKRTGRKRKRGSGEPFCGEVPQQAQMIGGVMPSIEEPVVISHDRQDLPSTLRRILQDNANQIKVEAVGTVLQTHRYHNIADFHASTSNTSFMPVFADVLLSANVEKMRGYRFDTSMGPIAEADIVPPPMFTDHVVPFNWQYKQNYQIHVHVDDVTGEKSLRNSSISYKLQSQYVSNTVDKVPQGSANPLPTNDPAAMAFIAMLRDVFEERPSWTRRGLSNRLGISETQSIFKECLPFVCYQFRGGPWRDCFVKFGIDPRSDPKYRIYQSLFFKIITEEQRSRKVGPKRVWNEYRSQYTRKMQIEGEFGNTHLFDGRNVHLDGKIWQVRDITDPVCLKIIEDGKPFLRTKVDLEGDGWFANGTYAKLKVVMRQRIYSLMAGVVMNDEEFTTTCASPDVVGNVSSVRVPVLDYQARAKDATKTSADEEIILVDVRNVDFKPNINLLEGGESNGRARRPNDATAIGFLPPVYEDADEEDNMPSSPADALKRPKPPTRTRGPYKKKQKQDLVSIGDIADNSILYGSLSAHHSPLASTTRTTTSPLHRRNSEGVDTNRKAYGVNEHSRVRDAYCLETDMARDNDNSDENEDEIEDENIDENVSSEEEGENDDGENDDEENDDEEGEALHEDDR